MKNKIEIWYTWMFLNGWTAALVILISFYGGYCAWGLGSVLSGPAIGGVIIGLIIGVLQSMIIIYQSPLLPRHWRVTFLINFIIWSISSSTATVLALEVIRFVVRASEEPVLEFIMSLIAGFIGWPIIVWIIGMGSQGIVAGAFLLIDEITSHRFKASDFI